MMISKLVSSKFNMSNFLKNHEHLNRKTKFNIFLFSKKQFINTNIYTKLY